MTEGFARRVIARSAQDRLPELFDGQQCRALYRMPDRHGISVVAVRTTELQDDQLRAILRYRLAQYLALGYVCPRRVRAAGWGQHEDRQSVTDDDVHVVAGRTGTGEILCYLTVHAPAGASADTLRTRERPRFPPEDLFGWGVYNRLRILPDLPLARIREVGRFVKNTWLPPHDKDLAIRAAAEVCVALLRTLMESLHRETDAVVGGVEEQVSKRNLDFFHVPHVVLRGALRYATRRDVLYPHWRQHPIVPVAFAIGDLFTASPRLRAVEDALDQPGISSLLRLRDDDGGCGRAASTLLPPEGLPAITEAACLDSTPWNQRRGLLARAHRLRATRLFDGLSVAEAAALARLCHRFQAKRGRAIVKQGKDATGLWLIDSGFAEVRVDDGAGGYRVVAMRGPGDCIGAAALVSGGSQPADVVPTEPVRGLRLTREDYCRYVRELPDAEQQIVRAGRQELDELH